MQATMNTPMIPEGEPNESNAKLWIKRILIGCLVMAVLVGLGYGIKKLMSGGAPQKKQITTIKLLDTPPPPPPPPPKEPPKEQPKEQPKEIKVEQPKPVETPPVETLKMEGPAGDAPSAFQAGAVTKDYEKGDVATVPKIGGKKGLAAFAFFTSAVDAHIKKVLAENKELSRAKYQVEVRIVFSSSGAIERGELLNSSGDDDTDKLLREVLANLPPLGEKAPEDMPRKVVLRVTSQTLG